MCPADRVGYLAADVGRLLRKERAVVAHHIAERTVREAVRGSLEHQPGPPIVFDDGEDAGDVRMIEPGKFPCLP